MGDFDDHYPDPSDRNTMLREALITRERHQAYLSNARVHATVEAFIMMLPGMLEGLIVEAERAGREAYEFFKEQSLSEPTMMHILADALAHAETPEERLTRLTDEMRKKTTASPEDT